MAQISETAKIVVSIGVYSVLAICLFCGIFGNLKLYRVRKSIWMQKRSPSLTFGLNFTLLLILIGTADSYALRVHATTIEESVSGVHFIINTILMAICIFSFLYFSTVKSWMIYFKERWTFYTLQQKWQQHLKREDINNNWFIRTNHKYGSLSYMYKLFGVVYIVMFMLLLTGIIFIQINILTTDFVIVLFIPNLILILIYIIIICKTKRLRLMDDIFFIHYEAKTQLKILSFILIFGIFQVAIQAIFIGFDYHGSQLAALIFSIINLSEFYLMHHISTYIIYNKNCKFMDENETNLEFETIKKISLTQVLSDNDSIHLFMLHLSNEINMEILLAFIEFTQFLEPILDTLNDENNNNIHLKKYKKIILPQEIPLSSINDNNDNIKTKAYELYQKYVQVGSEFEVKCFLMSLFVTCVFQKLILNKINVAYEQREAATELFDDFERLLENQSIKTYDIFNLYNSIRDELLILLDYSLKRFRRQTEYNKIIELFE